MAKLCFGAPGAVPPYTKPRLRQTDEKLGSRWCNGDYCKRAAVIGDSDPMLTSFLVVGENLKGRIVEQLGLNGKRHKDALALPFSSYSAEALWKPGWQEKADVLLLDVLQRNHGCVGVTQTPQRSATAEQAWDVPVGGKVATVAARPMVYSGS